jgi:hypothetical protein
VIQSSTYLHCTSAITKIDWSTGSIGACVVASYSKLAIKIASPTFDGTIIQYRTRVIVSSTYLHCSSASTKIDWSTGSVGVCVASYSKLALIIVSPTRQRSTTTRANVAGMEMSTSNFSSRGDHREVPIVENVDIFSFQKMIEAMMAVIRRRTKISVLMMNAAL